ncbi:hypothetical protein SEA_CEPENS_32 [Mycobacterium phage Cepens]|uniref:Minor tail protein gp31 C-terminal domain-containing protein n=1 Tax=Mycobacterium phage Taptic TaxID=1920305 RepID=A0A1J0ME00_9CAUD|nr:tail fiber protein [Mycobacterium phage Taptic]APD19262.1 hypothetical protein SEA_TAPTIC_32 [Mycobacterium phage Taptic]AVO21342.1 hypothetical protein PBI_MEGABEAR_32 [Mycobacterium phage Megabear]QBP31150.1 hypothetical protein SEA_ARGIE_33 [Mycobacterium phage Argie]QBP32696.1 hypothetical protein SEA_CEPENS_32 [Mycobacterium phage Cepens]
MGIIVLALDTSKPFGQQLSPELIAEIQRVAPSAVSNGSITTAKLRDLAVTAAKLALGAVHSEHIGTGEVKTVNLSDGTVTTEKVADNAITAVKVGIGVVTAVDEDDEPIEKKFKYLTATEFAAIESPDPNVTYMIRPDA